VGNRDKRRFGLSTQPAAVQEFKLDGAGSGQRLGEGGAPKSALAASATSRSPKEAAE